MRSDRGIQTQGKELDMVDLSYEVFHRDIEALVDFYTEVLEFQPPQSDPSADYAVVRRVGCCRHHHADSTPRRPQDPSGQYLRISSTASNKLMSSHA